MFPLLAWMVVGLAMVGADEVYDRANADYDAGKFAEAAEGYEEMLASEGPRAAVLQNLGSARFREGKFGEAILAFERGLLLEPGDPDLQANLKLARDEVAAFPIEESSQWKRFLEWPTRRQWSQLAMVAAILVPLSVVVWRLHWKRGSGSGWMVLAGGGISAVLMVFALYALKMTEGEAAKGIVVGKDVPLRISPFAKADTRGTLGEGRVVWLGREVDGYHWVTADGGSEGWVADGEVEAIVPGSQG